VTATAVHAGSPGIIFLDQSIPAGGLTPDEIAELGDLFDAHLFPIDTTLFGRPSDVDGNGAVFILLSDAVNALSGDCGGGVIAGYFLARDLLPGEPGSNGAEILYARVPDPASATCPQGRDEVIRSLPPLLLHELQHLINFGERVVTRGGVAEDGWLNEGLSHYAEEVGGRLVPPGPLLGDAPSRAAQFQQADIENAASYLLDPRDHYLVSPRSSAGSLPERGAQWLFLRWLVDHYDDSSGPNGSVLTRALVSGSETGARNVELRTGASFAELSGLWLLALYLDDLPGFVGDDTRLGFRSLDLRATMAQVYPRYPLGPDTTSGGRYGRTGVLHGGSGTHLLLVQPPEGSEVRLRLTAPDGRLLADDLGAQFAVARLR
jgi:hypothetical protein